MERAELQEAEMIKMANDPDVVDAGPKHAPGCSAISEDGGRGHRDTGGQRHRRGGTAASTKLPLGGTSFIPDCVIRRARLRTKNGVLQLCRKRRQFTAEVSTETDLPPVIVWSYSAGSRIVLQCVE